MKLLTTKQQDENHLSKRWDHYDQFHIFWGQFVQFEDGSLIYTQGAPEPYRRHFYPDFNVTVSCSTDADRPDLYLSRDAEEPLKTAWLSQGGAQYFIVDHDTKTAMRLKSGNHWSYNNNIKKDKSYNAHLVPENKRSGSIYWAGEGCQAVARNQFKVSTPARKLTAQLKPKLDDVRTAISAIYRMFSKEQMRQTGYYTEKFEPLLAWSEMTTEQIVTDIVGSGAANTNKLIANIAVSGFTTPRSEQDVTLLYIK